MSSQNYQTARLTAKYDAYKKLKCKSGFVQRGAVCQKEGKKTEDTKKSRGKAAGIAGSAAIVGAAGLLALNSRKQSSKTQEKLFPESSKAELPESKPEQELKQKEKGKLLLPESKPEQELKQKEKGKLLLPESKPEQEQSPALPKPKLDPLLARQKEILDKRNKSIEDIADSTGVSKKDAERMARSISAFTELGSTYENIRDAEKEGSPYFVKNYDDKERVDTIKEINSFLDKSPKYDGTVYRGISIKESALEGYLKQIQGDGLILKAMSSFSKDPEIGDGYAKANQEAENKKISIVLVCKKNKSGVDIEKYSEAPQEQEVLVPAGTFYKASKVEVKKGGKGRDVYYIHVDEVNPEKQKERRDKK